MSHVHDQLLEVLPVGDHAWRVCDRRMDPSDARRVLGFVEERHNRFELLRLGSVPTGRDRFDCLDAALDDLGAGLTARGSSSGAPRSGASKAGAATPRGGAPRRAAAGRATPRCLPGPGGA